jgi:phosphatidate cytidylyltransferase
LIALVVLVAAWEWINLIKIASQSSKLSYMICLIMLLFGAHFILDVYGNFAHQLSYQICLFALLLWGIIFLWIQGYPSSAILWASKPVQATLGVILLLATWVSLAAIISYDNGKWLFLLAMVVVVLADLGGYVAGRIFGRHKLAPVISPGKTWEGLFGGLFLQLLLMLGLKLFIPSLTLASLAILIIPVALISVIGDLFESMIKRYQGVKDSGTLLPGHGGVLDRLDGVMAAMPMFWVIVSQSNPF